MTSWLFPQRLGRLAWLSRFVLFIVPTLVLVALTGPRGAFRPYLGDLFGEIIGWTILVVALFYTFVYIHLPRCRSLGLPSAALIALFLPPLNILLLMMFLLAGENYWLRIRQRQRQILSLVTIPLTILSSGCATSKPHHPRIRYQTHYYDRNHDGIVDFERHHAIGVADADWTLSDEDFDGHYDEKTSLGYAISKLPIYQPVPRNVPLTKPPKNLR